VSLNNFHWHLLGQNVVTQLQWRLEKWSYSWPSWCPSNEGPHVGKGENGCWLVIWQFLSHVTRVTFPPPLLLHQLHLSLTTGNKMSPLSPVGQFEEHPHSTSLSGILLPRGQVGV
jgi:hypothetical protein